MEGEEPKRSIFLAVCQLYSSTIIILNHNVNGDVGLNYNSSSLIPWPGSPTPTPTQATPFFVLQAIGSLVDTTVKLRIWHTACFRP